LERKRQPWEQNGNRETLKGFLFRQTLSESVGKIKIRKKQGMKNHSSSSKNSLQGKYAQEIF